LQKFASKAGLGVDITVYERSSFVGGRSTTVNAYNDPTQPVELGATIFVDVNFILKNATKHFGLNYSQTTEKSDDDILGIWNGETFVFKQKESGWSYWDLAKMFWKYGFAPRRTQTLMQKALKQFTFLYEPPFFPFRSLTNRAIDLGLSEFASVTGRQLLEKNSVSHLQAYEE
jgi:prenylcysteine oxidase/farnesylcysteine lyase